MRKPVIAGNWKMHKTIKEAIEFCISLKRSLADVETVDVIVCPPFTALSEVSEVFIGSNIKVAGQNLHWQEKGAFTGEISARMIKDTGAEFVIIGHSERRQYFHETNETVNKKLKAALKEGLYPIVCVGETLTEREQGMTFQVNEVQLKGALDAVSQDELRNVMIAYEPVWAIGTGKTATSDQAEEVHKFLRSLIEKWYNKTSAQSVRIQYGGSVKPDNIEELIKRDNIDGALVGGASLEAETFSRIVLACM